MDLSWIDWGIRGVFQNPQNVGNGVETFYQFIFWFSVIIPFLESAICWIAWASEADMWWDKNKTKAAWVAIFTVPLYFIIFFFWAIFLVNLGVGWWMGIGILTAILFGAYSKWLYIPVFDYFTAVFEKKQRLNQYINQYNTIKNQI